MLVCCLGEVMQLSPEAEEVATFYAKMLEHDYTKKEIFNTNFFEDWRKEMTSEERKVIKKLELCDFKEMAEHFKKVRDMFNSHVEFVLCLIFVMCDEVKVQPNCK